MRRDSKNRVLAPIEYGPIYGRVVAGLFVMALGACAMGALLYRDDILRLLGVW